MAPLALLLAVCALLAPLHAASIPEHDSKIPAPLSEDNKQPAPAEPTHDLADLVEQTENELRAKPEGIPVAVVLDAEPSVNLNEVDEEFQRPPVDLRNPGPPQRQEHETQNPERHSDELLKVSTIQESIDRTHVLLRQSFQDVTDNIQNWFTDNEGQLNIQKNIKTLRDTFSNQIQKLNDTIQALVKPAADPSEQPAQPTLRNYESIESRLKILKDNFNHGVETLSAGVELVASLKSGADDIAAAKEEPAVGEAAAAPEAPAVPVAPAAPVAPAQPPAAAPPYIVQAIQNSLTAIRNITTQNLNALSNFISPTSPAPASVPAGVQADAPVASTSPPFFGGIFNRPNFTNPFQNFQNPLQNFTLTNPFPNLGSNLGSNLGIFSDFWNNYVGPISSTAKPSESSNSAAASPQADKPADASASQPAAAITQPAAQSAADAAQPAAQPGPIQQFLNNIPVVQRIQNSLANRDTPRQPAAAAVAPTPAPAEKSDSHTKGGWLVAPHKPGGSGDNNDSGLSEKKTEEIKEPIKEDIKKETEEEIKPEPVAEKTD